MSRRCSYCAKGADLRVCGDTATNRTYLSTKWNILFDNTKGHLPGCILKGECNGICSIRPVYIKVTFSLWLTFHVSGTFQCTITFPYIFHIIERVYHTYCNFKGAWTTCKMLAATARLWMLPPGHRPKIPQNPHLGRRAGAFLQLWP